MGGADGMFALHWQITTVLAVLMVNPILTAAWTGGLVKSDIRELRHWQWQTLSSISLWISWLTYRRKMLKSTGGADLSLLELCWARSQKLSFSVLCSGSFLACASCVTFEAACPPVLVQPPIDTV